MAKTKRKKYKRKSGSLTKTKAATKLQHSRRGKILRKHSRRVELYKNLPEELQKKVNKNYYKIDLLKPQSNELLMRGAEEGNLEKVKFALERYGDVNIRCIYTGQTPLFKASEKGHLTIVKLLLKNGANLNVKDKDGATPLHVASYYGNQEVVKLLLVNGTNVNSQDVDGVTPLYNASKRGYLEIVKLLLDARANVNMQTYDLRETALHIITEKDNMETDNYLEIAKLLIKFGADINATDKFGDTPLHNAIIWGHPDIVKFLLDTGAIVHIQNHQKETPLDKEKELNGRHTAIAILLKKAQQSRNH